jgi:hypothetical protein
MADEVIDVFLPVLFYWWEKRRWRKAHANDLEVAAHGVPA